MVVSQSTPNDSTPTPARKQATTTAGRASGNAKRKGRQREQQHSERRREQHPARPQPQHRQAAADEPDRFGREDSAPRCRAAEVLLRDRRTEHVRGSRPGRVDDRELQNDRPKPAPRAELEPALSQLGEEARAGLPHSRRQAQQGLINTAAAKKVRESTAIAQPGLEAATTRPPSAAPEMELRIAGRAAAARSPAGAGRPGPSAG